MFSRYYPGIYDPDNGWKMHMNHQASLDEITTLLRKKQTSIVLNSNSNEEIISSLRDDFINSITELNEEISSSIMQSTAIVCNTLETGFNIISKDINNLARSIDFRLSLIHEQEVLGNLIAENIALLLRIPEIQKERQFFLEQGLKHLKNSYIDKDMYEYALKNLLEAEKREETDYVTLHHIGIIYLYSEKYLDLAKAETYLKKAAKFAKIEIDPKAAKLANIMSGSVLSKLSENTTDDEKMRHVAAESYFQAAIACYIQEKYSESAKLAMEAFELAPDMSEALYYACLSYALVQKEDKVIDLLCILIDKNPNYLVVVSTDPVFASLKYVQRWLIELRNDKIEEGIGIIESYNEIILKNSIFKYDLDTAYNKLLNCSYLEALNIIQYLDTGFPLTFENDVFNKNKSNLKIIKNTLIEESLLNTFNDDVRNLENLLLGNGAIDQWEISEKIFNLSKGTIMIIEEKYHKSISTYLSLDKKNKQNNNTSPIVIRTSYLNNFFSILGSTLLIGGVLAPILGVIIGFKGCVEILNKPIYTGFQSFEYLLKAIFYGIIILIFAFIATYIVQKINENIDFNDINIKKLKREKSQKEIEEEMSNKKQMLLIENEYNACVKNLSKIKIIQRNYKYTPFNEYLQQNHRIVDTHF